MIVRLRYLALIALLVSVSPRLAWAQADSVSTLNAMFARLGQCWRPPPRADVSNGFQITVLFALKRDGTILGKPKVTFETQGATEEQRIAYRIAAMETLQRCTPMPFSGGLGDAVGGRPFRMRFDDRRNSPQPSERKA